MDVEALERSLGHQFGNARLPRQALTHRSYGQPNNERLEFLGDSVLNCAIAALLFEQFPQEDEGDLSRLRAFLVKQQALYRVAQRLELGQMLQLGEGENRSGGFRRPSILADALEALIGAVYLDAGFDVAKAMIGRLYKPELAAADPKTTGKDAKTRLQEELQRRRLPLPVYSVVATHGAAHSQTFDVECLIAKLEVSVSGAGATRRAAEQSAAEQALEKLASIAPASSKATKKRTTRAPSAKARKAQKSTTSASSAAAPARSTREKASRAKASTDKAVSEKSAPDKATSKAAIESPASSSGSAAKNANESASAPFVERRKTPRARPGARKAGNPSSGKAHDDKR
ncbi:MAG: ribonuclease III [Burkholderiaceae bacterium]